MLACWCLAKYICFVRYSLGSLDNGTGAREEGGAIGTKNVSICNASIYLYCLTNNKNEEKHLLS